MHIIILILVRLLVAFSPVVVSESHNSAVLYMRDTGDYVCLYRWEDDSVSVGVGRDEHCIEPDATDIDMWQQLDCDGQWEQDTDDTINFYYKCRSFKVHTTYVTLVSK